MPRYIDDECISCMGCEDTCPNDAISYGGERMTIDAEKCIDCGACDDTCPVQAIKLDLPIV